MRRSREGEGRAAPPPMKRRTVAAARDWGPEARANARVAGMIHPRVARARERR